MSEVTVRASGSFGQASRFPSLRSQSPDLLFNPGPTFNKRSTSFGYGARTKSLNPYSSNTPPPGAYDPVYEDRRKKGATFMPRRSSKPAVTPGPGDYEPDMKRKLGNVRFGTRQAQLPVLVSHSPTPTTYTPIFSSVFQRRIRNVSFGSAKRFSAC